MTLSECLERYRGETVHVLLNKGNAGDGLIHLGGRHLFRQLGLKTREFLYPTDISGKVVLIFGSGAFCQASGHRVEHSRHYFDRFEKIVILPSSFDTSRPQVAEFLRTLPGHVTVFCREKISHELALACISHPENLHLSEDLAFHYDYTPWLHRTSKGTLVSFRTDGEAALESRPSCSIDVSRYGDKHDAWPLLYTVSRFEEVYTDRTHVGIAGALMGKTTFIYDNNYHKNRAIYEHSLAKMDNVHYMGSKEPEVVARLGSRVRMRSIHLFMRVRKPLVRALFSRQRKRYRQPDSSRADRSAPGRGRE